MVTVRDVARWMEQLAPASLAAHWDRVGLQIGDGDRRVRRVMTALTPTRSVLEQAKRQRVDLIVAHHPLIFQPLESIDPKSRVGALVVRLIQEDIALYVTHTNLDMAEGGVNDGLARRLDLRDLKPLVPAAVREENGDSPDTMVGLGRIGHLREPMDGKSFISWVKDRLSLGSIRRIGDDERTVRRVAVLGGSGGSYVVQAHENGADTFITGDVDFHDADEAEHRGLFVIDAGHFGTEKHVPHDVAAYLKKRAGDADLDVSVAEEEDPFISVP